MQTAGLVITVVAGVAIFAVGILYLTVPMRMATNFGIPDVPAANARPWLQLKGIRDAATGVAAAMLLVTAPPDVIGWVLLAFVIVPLGDAATVWLTGGPRWIAIGIHGATAAVMGGAAALLLS